MCCYKRQFIRTSAVPNQNVQRPQEPLIQTTSRSRPDEMVVEKIEGQTKETPSIKSDPSTSVRLLLKIQHVSSIVRPIF